MNPTDQEPMSKLEDSEKPSEDPEMFLVKTVEADKGHVVFVDRSGSGGFWDRSGHIQVCWITRFQTRGKQGVTEDRKRPKIKPTKKFFRRQYLHPARLILVE